MRLTKSQIECVASLAKATSAHSFKIEQLREVHNATCAVRITPVGPAQYPSYDVAITGNVRLSK